MVSILLASYNGEKYITEQIDSLLCQTFQNFKLFICDDKSTDGTYSLILRYAEKYPDRILVAQNKENSSSAKYNFMQMMISHKDDYVMLCDQDDVWLPNKIEITLAKMKEMESRVGADSALLVHTDLRVVSEDLTTVISPSFKEAMNSNFNRVRLRDQIIQNTLTGCTVIYNRTLADLIDRMPRFMVMHDWWLMLIASAFGGIEGIDAQTVLYRQHNENSIGAKDVRKIRYKINKLVNYSDMKLALEETYLQAESFLSAYRAQLNDEQIELLETYCKIPGMSKIRRWQTMCRLGCLKNGISRKIASFIFV